MERLNAQLLQRLEQRAYVELQAQLAEGEFLPPESVTVEILSEVYDQFLEAQADVLGLTMRVAASGAAIDVAKAHLLAYESLESKIPDTYDLTSEEISFELDDQVRMDGWTSVLQVTAVAQLVADVDRGAVRSAATGLPAEEAAQVLAESFALGAQPLVEVQPDWIKRWTWLDRVPFVPFRVQVVVME
jgi:hypothetical protein